MFLKKLNNGSIFLKETVYSIKIERKNFIKTHKLFHLSSKDLEELHATIPNNYFCKIGAEECTIPRISCASEIKYCLVGMSDNLENKKFFVYEPEFYDSIVICENKFLVKNNLVPDADITKEIWILNKKIKVKKVGEIKVGKAINKKYKFFYDKDGKKEEAFTYFWNWNWI